MSAWGSTSVSLKPWTKNLLMRKDQHVHYCTWADQRAGSFAKIIGQTWPALPCVCDQSGNRYSWTDRESGDLFYPKRPGIKSWEPFIFQWFRGSRIMGMLDAWDHNLSVWWGGASCQCGFARRYLVTNGWKSGVVWSGRGDRIHWCLQPLWLEKQAKSPYWSRSTLFRHLFEPSARRSPASLCLTRDFFASTP